MGNDTIKYSKIVYYNKLSVFPKYKGNPLTEIERRVISNSLSVLRGIRDSIDRIVEEEDRLKLIMAEQTRVRFNYQF